MPGNEVALTAERSVSFIVACGPSVLRGERSFRGHFYKWSLRSFSARGPADDSAATTRFLRAGFAPECDTHSPSRVDRPSEPRVKGRERASRISTRAYLSWRRPRVRHFRRSMQRGGAWAPTGKRKSLLASSCVGTTWGVGGRISPLVHRENRIHGSGGIRPLPWITRAPRDGDTSCFRGVFLKVVY